MWNNYIITNFTVKFNSEKQKNMILKPRTKEHEREKRRNKDFVC